MFFQMQSTFLCEIFQFGKFIFSELQYIQKLSAV